MNNQLSAVIIDDESGSRENLKLLLKNYCPSIDLVGMAANVPTGLAKIAALKPEVIFLDIEMPGQDGFEMLEQLPDRYNYKVVFTTAYEAYAVKAFRVSAVDYLLKPININDLKHAIEKLNETKSKDQESRVGLLKENLTNGIKKIAIPHQDGFTFERLDNIVYLEANRNYTCIHREENNTFLVAKSLREFEDLLSSAGFFRTHRSFLINLRHVEEWVKKDGGYIVMSNEHQIPLVKDRRESFLNCYQGL